MPKYYQRSSPIWSPINTRLKIAKLLLSDKDGTALFGPTGHLNAANVLLDEIMEHMYETEGVVGTGITDYPLASAVSFLSIMSNFHPLDALYLNGNCVAGRLERKNSRLVVLKREVHTGKKLIRSIEILRSMRYKILGAVVLVDHQGGAVEAMKKKKIPLYSIFTNEEAVTEVEEWDQSVKS